MKARRASFGRAWVHLGCVCACQCKLNAQVQLTKLRTMYERGTATSDQRRQLDLEFQDWARLQGRGPQTAGGHGRNRHIGRQEQ